MACAVVPVNFVACVESYPQWTGVKSDAGAGIEHAFPKAPFGSLSYRLYRRDAGDRDQLPLRVEAVAAALQKEEETAAGRLKLEAGIGVDHAQFRVRQDGAGGDTGCAERRVLEVIATLEFELQIPVNVEVDASSKAESVVWKLHLARLAVTLVAAETTEFNMLSKYCARKAGNHYGQHN